VAYTLARRVKFFHFFFILGASCGGEVSVDDNWSFVSSPGYPTNYKEGQECSWLVTAPPGQHVQLEYIGTFDLYCKAKHSLCMDYVEIRNGSDFSNTGMR